MALLAGAPTPSVRAGDAQGCAAAGTEAETMLQVPPGLLLAIGRVESGRRDPDSGRIVAWPWTINAAGKGQSFYGAAAALAATRALLARGVASIDVGCFQVNLAFHPDAFETLEAAFDPQTNARAAARFLAALRGQTGSWERAIAAYHSAMPERGTPYRLRVLAEWGQKGLEYADADLAAIKAPVLREVSWSPARGGVQVWKPSNQGAGPSVISMHAVPALPSIRTVSAVIRY